jgi:D-cysteine desulfhydrase family pyridoxal phosphate-dependent enzyme
MLTDQIKRISLGHLPTPIHALPRLTDRLGGPQLFVKRDDQTGLATGGNKTRKLEFLVADALERKADTLITAGAPQSNHARQTAAAAACVGLKSVLVLRGQPPAESQGNLLLDELLGAQIRWAEKSAVPATMEAVAAELRAQGRTPYVIPYGGSNPVGAAGYVAAMEEMVEQARQMNVTFDRVVFASSSGGTQAGLAVGSQATGYAGQVLGISVDVKREELQTMVATLANETAAHLKLGLRLTPGEISVNADYIGAGYGVLGAQEREAIRLAAEVEGLLLDPVYTGRAFAGMVDLIRRGEIRRGETVLFWHTGGTPAWFAYAAELSAP